MKIKTGRKRKRDIFNCVDCNKRFNALVDNVKRIGFYRCMECGKKSMASKKTGATVTHGDASKTSRYYNLYRVYNAMKYRCSNKNNKDYGGRGIIVCDEWVKSYGPFKEWAISNGYRSGLTIDRRDNDGNYCSGNCRFVGMDIQSTNQRKRITNTSGYVGVRFVKRENSWLSTITVNYKEVYIGHFKNVLDGAIARENYIIKNNLPHHRNFTNG